jgi:hypothetical protein
MEKDLIISPQARSLQPHGCREGKKLDGRKWFNCVNLLVAFPREA